jgi:hypothetical protein
MIPRDKMKSGIETLRISKADIENRPIQNMNSVTFMIKPSENENSLIIHDVSNTNIIKNTIKTEMRPLLTHNSKKRL